MFCNRAQWFTSQKGSGAVETVFIAIPIALILSLLFLQFQYYSIREERFISQLEMQKRDLIANAGPKDGAEFEKELMP